MARIDIVRVKALCREGLFEAYIESGGIYLKDTISGEVVKLGDAPTIDPVKHGRWVCSEYRKWFDDKDTCSVCGFYRCTHPSMAWATYCPSCGAKMDGIGADQDATKTADFDRGSGKKPTDCKGLRGGPDCGMDGDAHD